MVNNMDKKLKWIISLGIAVGLLIIILYMTGHFESDVIAPGKRQVTVGMPAPRFTAIVISIKRPVWYEAVGTVNSRIETTVAPQVTGLIVNILVKEGDAIEKDNLIATLNNEEFQARMEQTRSGVDAAKAELEQAQSHYQRIERLFKQNAATQEQREIAETRMKQAEAGMKVAEQKLKEASITFGYTRIFSPLTGVVTKRSADPGDLAWPGKALVSIHDPDNLELVADIREGLIHQIKLGDAVEVQIASVHQTVPGIVGEIVPLADPASRSFLVKVALPKIPNLFPGVFGKLKIKTGERDAVMVAAQAVVTIGQLQTVILKIGDHWQRRYVTTGSQLDGEVEILSGLRGGETIGWDEGSSDGLK
jgi:HlyD family secretion protein